MAPAARPHPVTPARVWYMLYLGLGTRRRRRPGYCRSVARQGCAAVGTGEVVTWAYRCSLATSVAWSGRTRVTTVPAAPARAVRPERCRYALGSAGGSK